MKSLLIISYSDIRSDARVLKQVNEFSRDFEVTTCSYGEAPEGVAHHLQIPDRLVYWAYSRADLILHQYRRAYWTNPVVRFIKGAMVGRRYDVILADDIDPVPLALALNPRFGVHADLHEYAPREKEELLRWRLFVGPFRAWLCRKYLPKCASVTTVGKGIADEYSRQFGARVGVVMNATPQQNLPVRPTSRPIRLVHSGACMRGRGIEQIAAGVEGTRADVTLDLYLTPSDPVFLSELKDQYQGPRIRFHDPVPYEHLLSVLSEADVGIHLLSPVNFNHLWALPNKFFDYVQARLGVITGPSPEMAEIIRRHGLGAVTKGFTARDLSDLLDGLTPEQVDQWKLHSDEVAEELSAADQVAIWRQYIEALVSP